MSEPQHGDHHGTGSGTGIGTDRTPTTTAAEDPDAVGFWESRYGERAQIWSGQPNAALAGTVADLAPGRALDLGCGEGGDSIWLAGRGWQVTAVDISATAVERASARARAEAIPDDRITWIVADLATWQPVGPYELVSACFLHSPVEFPRAEVLRRAAGTIAVGGHLLIVSHAERPPWAAVHDHAPHAFPALDEQLAELRLDEDAWESVVSETRDRDAAGPDGERALLQDHVILLRRRR